MSLKMVYLWEVVILGGPEEANFSQLIHDWNIYCYIYTPAVLFGYATKNIQITIQCVDKDGISPVAFCARDFCRDGWRGLDFQGKLCFLFLSFFNNSYPFLCGSRRNSIRSSQKS